MESTGSDILQGRALNSEMRGDALIPGKIPKIVHQGWLKKKGIQIVVVLFKSKYFTKNTKKPDDLSTMRYNMF